MTLNLFSQPELLTASHNRNGQDKDFQKNRLEYHSQAMRLFREMLKGERVNQFTAFAMIPPIGDARPRFAALKKAGVKFEEDKNKKTGLVTRHMNQEQIEFNKKHFQEYL